MKRTNLISCALAALLACLSIGAGPLTMSGGFSYTPTLTLPDTTFVVGGRECNFWWDQLVPKLADLVPCYFTTTTDTAATGSTNQRGYRWSPGAGLSTGGTLTIKARDVNSAVLATATTRMKRVLKVAGSDTIDVLVVGDSTIENAITVKEIFDLVAADGGGEIRLLGNTEEAGADSLNEGHSGASWSNFTTATGPATSGNTYGAGVNPFWDSVAGNLNFQKWMCANSLTGDIDYCIVHLGINDMFALGAASMTAANQDTVKARINRFCTALFTRDRGFPYCKVILSLPPAGTSNLSAWYDDYGAGTTANDVWPYYLRNMDAYRELLINTYDNGAWHANVTVCPTWLLVDPVYGYPRSDVVVNARAVTTIPTYNNYVHPDSSGYRQMADAMYSALRGEWRKTTNTNLILDSEKIHDTGTWTVTGAGASAGSDIADPYCATCVDAKTMLHAADTATYISYNPSQVVASNNTISAYFHKPTGQTVSVGIYADLAVGHSDRFAALVLNSNSGTAVVNTISPSDTTTPYMKFRYTYIGGNWFRVRLWFQNLAGAADDDAGIALDAIRFYANYLTGSMPEATVGIWGMQFQQDTQYDATTYHQKP